MTDRSHIVFSGIGNEMRHDDGAGPCTARLAMRTLETGGDDGTTISWSALEEPLMLLDAWDGVDLAVVVDAVRSGEPAGTVSLVWLTGEKRGAKAEGAWGTSSHALGVAGVHRLALALGRGPRQLVLIGIEGQDFSPGQGLSEPVEKAVEVAAAVVVELLSAYFRASGLALVSANAANYGARAMHAPKDCPREAGDLWP
jgi:hydrogenase maturation protease